MASLLAADRYDDIRRVLDPTLDLSAVRDDLIASDMYAGQAERWLVSLDPLAATRAMEPEKSAVQRALVYYTAALLSEVTPVAKTVDMPGSKAGLDRETQAQRSMRLFAAAETTVAGYVTPEVIPITVRAPLFVVAVRGGRSS